MKATDILHQKQVLKHRHESRLAIFEIVVWRVPVSRDFPDGIKYRVWLSENGVTLFGFDNHKPKGPHLHKRNREESYEFKDVDQLIEDFWILVRMEGFLI